MKIDTRTGAAGEAAGRREAGQSEPSTMVSGVASSMVPDLDLTLENTAVLRAVGFRPLHPSKQTYRGPMSALGH